MPSRSSLSRRWESLFHLAGYGVQTVAFLWSIRNSVGIINEAGHPSPRPLPFGSPRRPPMMWRRRSRDASYRSLACAVTSYRRMRVLLGRVGPTAQARPGNIAGAAIFNFDLTALTTVMIARLLKSGSIRLARRRTKKRTARTASHTYDKSTYLLVFGQLGCFGRLNLSLREK